MKSENKATYFIWTLEVLRHPYFHKEPSLLYNIQIFNSNELTPSLFTDFWLGHLNLFIDLYTKSR